MFGEAIKHTANVKMGRASSSSLNASGTSGGEGDASEAEAAAAPSSAPITATASPATDTTTVSAQQRLQDRKVYYIRAVMLTTLLAATALVSAFTWWFVVQDESNNFELQYGDSVAKVAEAFHHRIEMKRDTAMTFSAMITSRYGDVALWPNVTVPDFQEQTAGIMAIAGGRALSFNPIITQDVDRLGWEAHAAESAWMLGDGHESLVTSDPNVDAQFPDNRTVSFGIYSRDSNRNVVYDPGYAPESPENYQDVMVPVWQIAPIKTNEKAVMFNLHSEGNRREALDHMMEHRVPTLTAILQLVQDAETRPSSILFYPVFDNFSDDEDDKPPRKVVGSISIVFSWDNLLEKILPDYIKGMICVLRSSTGQEFSYSVSGRKVTFLGEGDKHDAKYANYGQHVKANLIGMNGNNDNSHLGLITYELLMYPSSEFKAQYVTNRAAIYAGGVVLIFLFTACLFLLYDYLVENRQQKTARMARNAGNIVDSMFPAAFRERLYNIQNNDDASARRIRSSSRNTNALRSSINSIPESSDRGGEVISMRSSSAADSSIMGDEKGCKTNGAARVPGIGRVSLPLPRQMGVRRSTTNRSGGKKALRKQIDVFMKSNRVLNGTSGDQSNCLAPQIGGVDDEPIADLYHDTSIMFSDIVGFTKWSSERSPNEVFHLLEQIFWEFDDIAARHNVFKLGTIGDCYIAVTGIPNPIEDHATVLTQFAFEARDKVREVCSRLEGEGLDAARLDMRFGIHSGATTAGILRGTKSRFELFGDTINTASRMESTGSSGKIQVSEETAELIRLDGKSRWLIKRDTMITAKGKGQLQTYWVEPQRASCRVSFSENVAEFCLNENLESSRESDQDFYRETSESTTSDLYLDESNRNRDSGHLSPWGEEEKV